MARGYTVATAALALGTTRKWIDNVLSHHIVPGVVQSRQGVARKISADAVLQLALIHRLAETMGIPIQHALKGAHTLSEGLAWELGLGISLSLDRPVALEGIERQLEYAVEAAPVPRRGRPPGKAKRGA